MNSSPVLRTFYKKELLKELLKEILKDFGPNIGALIPL